MIVISKTLLDFPLIRLLQVLTKKRKWYFLTTYQAMTKARALFAASLSRSSSLRGSYMKVCEIMPIVPPCFAWIGINIC